MTEASEFMLTTPESVAADPKAIEVLRMWWSKEEPVMSVKPAFSDPIQFGRLLAYAARHMAHGYAVRHDHDETAAYNRILEGLSEVVKAANVRTVAEPTTHTGGNA
ncbi:MAG: DUF5076 domain-containing protein [Alphaproteobacteria bacterium]|uniref:DUF5076 domain-containing protein n=1 Tax=Brevundimonas mediterranea TaxID=74329 RepID=A0A7Z8Y633_9CAUL|nr:MULTISPECIES: DUF5076 domain-containing protein [Brevundimonas]MBU4197825.1 DUF5076 domain-containing protein [Alphaproteobacteria bacterium]OGN45917.1 MAG: hypothetical protein A3E24_10025 [Caulobacterales bacterium RIFCSPHIGHO2_12_FULL_68_13]MBU4238592.1 DUF5076 domain-containing protein [Alphaproteobacteria bacterium]MCG2665107.1 DUF5076 domain-containing protein [Brevundimonas sp.]PZO08119.1 MAG: hypothetical protein DCF29_02560 [Alphaproteobacteria bacterium]